MHRGWIRRFYPIGEQKVQLQMPAGRRAKRVELLRAEADIPFRLANGTVEFTILQVLDYEIAAIYSAYTQVGWPRPGQLIQQR